MPHPPNRRLNLVRTAAGHADVPDKNNTPIKNASSSATSPAPDVDANACGATSKA